MPPQAPAQDGMMIAPGDDPECENSAMPARKQELIR
jgi:hypothetical protein